MRPDILEGNKMIATICERKIPRGFPSSSFYEKMYFPGDSEQCKAASEHFKKIGEKKLTTVQRRIVENRIVELSRNAVNRWIALHYK